MNGAFVPDLPGCIAAGATKKEAKNYTKIQDIVFGLRRYPHFADIYKRLN